MQYALGLGLGIGGALGFNPLSLSPSLWLSDTGSDASTWTDLSGNGRHATQATGSQQPTIVANALNGRQVRRFDGVDDSMTGSPLWTGADPGTMIAVYVPRVTTGVEPIFAQSTSTGIGSWRSLQFRTTGVVGDPYFAGYIADLTDSAAPTTDPKIATFIYDGTDGFLYRNGTQIATGALSLNTASANYTIGADSSAVGSSMDCAEILAFTSALSSTNRLKLERYLGAKYGITVA